VGPVGSISAGHARTIGGEALTTAGAETAVRKVRRGEGLEVPGTWKDGDGIFETEGACTTLLGELAPRAVLGRGGGCARGDEEPEAGGCGVWGRAAEQRREGVGEEAPERQSAGAWPYAGAADLESIPLESLVEHVDMEGGAGLAVGSPGPARDERVRRSAAEEDVEPMASELLLPSRSASSFA